MAARKAAGPRPARRKISPRVFFTRLAVALALIVVALVAVLVVLLSRPETFLAGGEPVSGIQPIWVVTGPGTGEYPLFERPMGVALGAQGRIYVTDTGNNRVCVFDRRGRFLFEFGGHGVVKPGFGGVATWEPGLLNYPVGIDTDEDGNVYVADFRNDQIQVFDRDGTWLRAFPDPFEQVGKGSSGQDGGGIAVTDVAVADGKVYALDTWQVFVFTTEGELLDQWGMPGIEQGNLDHPNGIAVGDDGVVYVSDSNNARVQAFSAEGEVLWTVGSNPGSVVPGEESAVAGDSTSTVSAGDRELELPRGLVTEDGHLVVVDAFAQSVVRISWDGRISGRFGIRGTAPGELNYPNDIDVVGDAFIIADRGNGRIQLVRLVLE